MSHRLPQLGSLRAFEAAARHLSFRKAAEELNVTPAAISQRVRALEEDVGAALFHRLTRRVALTEAGRAAAEPMREGFERLAAAVEAMRAHVDDGVVTVSAAPSFAAKWLVPRMDRFALAHPDYDLNVHATPAVARLRGDGVDMALRYGVGRWEGLLSECLVGDETFPVCSPKLLERGPPLATPADLAHHTLLHMQWHTENETAPSWRMWALAAGVDLPNAERGPRFHNDGLAVEAAAEGHGVVLASRAVAGLDLAAGRLVRPFAAMAARPTAFCYWLVYPPGALDVPKLRAFRDWIMAEATSEA
ncbi:MAG: transcriptional regulator GcvA [Paracoccaceae bacterium]